MPTHQDETLQQRYARENQDYLKLCGSMTAEQVADLQLQLNNALARGQALQQRLTAADERADVLESRLEECVTEMFLALEDHAVRSAMTVIGRTRFLELVKAHHAALKPAEGGGDEAI